MVDFFYILYIHPSHVLLRVHWECSALLLAWATAWNSTRVLVHFELVSLWMESPLSSNSTPPWISTPTPCSRNLPMSWYLRLVSPFHWRFRERALSLGPNKWMFRLSLATVSRTVYALCGMSSQIIMWVVFVFSLSIRNLFLVVHFS